MSSSYEYPKITECVVSEEGIFDLDMKPLPLTVEDGISYVKLDWYRGPGLYDAGLVVMRKLHAINIYEDLLDEAHSLYIDGNPENIKRENLLYRFKNGKLEHKGYPGYYYVPFFTHYVMNEQGEVISLLTGQKKSWTRSKGDPKRNKRAGYLFQRVVNDNGFTAQMFQHRAMGYVFLEYGADVMTKIINHKNGIKWDNRPCNIEWTTYSENNKHAVDSGLRTEGLHPVKVKDYNTGEIRVFPSIAACCAAYPCLERKRVWYWMTRKTKFMPACNLYFKEVDDDTPWPDWQIGQHRRLQEYNMGHPIAAIDKQTGKRYVFASIAHAQRETGVSNVTIMKYCRNRLTEGRSPFIFRYFEDVSSMPVGLNDA